MHKVSGIGGFFFRAKDPDALDRWYFENLGIDPVPMTEGAQSWRQDAGETAFTSMEGTVDPTTYPMGRFASLTDPEGNPIQLWEPTGDAAS